MIVAPLPSIEELAAELESLTAKPGTVVDAVVARVEGDIVALTFEGGTGKAALAEFGKAPAPGDTCRVYVDEYDDGDAMLSVHKAARADVYTRLEAAAEDGTALPADVLKVVRGGLSVQVLGAKAFLAANNLDQRPERLEDWLQKSLEVRVLSLEGFKGRIEVAHADVKIESPEEAQARLFAELEVGAIVEGTVRRFAQFGAFVDLGGFDGLVPTAELSWGRVHRPADAVELGQRVPVKVMKLDAEKGRISLSRKAALPDPWLTIEETFPAGAVLTGTVTGGTEFGVFVALTDGLEGLVHISELTWGPQPKNTRSFVKRGQQVQVLIIEADGLQRRIRLSMRQAQSNPWDTVRETYSPGTRIRGTVRSVTDFGVFIGVTEGIDGLVHASDIAWGRTLRDLKAHFRKGDAVEAMVLNVDVERQRLSLGIKQLTADDSDSIYDPFTPGTIVEGTVIKVVDFGAFVEVADGIEGLVHRTEVADPTPEDLGAVLRAGDTIKVLVLSVDAGAGRVSLSIKQLPPEAADPVGDLVVAAPVEDAPPGDAIVAPPISGLVPSAVPPPAKLEALIAPPPPAEANAAPPIDIVVIEETPSDANAPAGGDLVPPPIAGLTPSAVPPPARLVPAVADLVPDVELVPAVEPTAELVPAIKPTPYGDESKPIVRRRPAKPDSDE